jgi:hypothetical protein
VKLANRRRADIKSTLYVRMQLSCAKDLTESYVQLYEIFAQRSGFQREDLKKTISLVSLKVHLVLGYDLF